MTLLEPGTAVATRLLGLSHDTVPEGQRVEGAPATGALELGSVGGLDLGVWEMTEGAMRDVETDEVFVVVAGRASVAIDGYDEPLTLEPGVIARLQEGMRTVWTVTEPLRKVYVLGR
ncbi:MAG: cupin domain-containing protein [Janthinobacterium lividum]